MKKLVVKLDLYDDKGKQKALQIVSGESGIESIQIELKDKKLTVVGDIDPVSVVRKLRKVFTAEMVSVGPAEKKEEPGKKAEETTGAQKDTVAELLKAYEAYNPYVRSVEENPNACVI